MTRNAIVNKIYAARISGIYNYLKNADKFIYKKNIFGRDYKLEITLTDKTIEFKHGIYKDNKDIYLREFKINIENIWNFNIYYDDILEQYDFIIYLKGSNETLCF